MPLIRIENYSRFLTLEEKMNLAEKVREAAFNVGVHGIERVQQITVVCGGEQMNFDDDCIIVSVEYLLDLPERNKDTRDKFARAIVSSIEKYGQGHVRLEGCPIEVFVKRFNEEKDSFFAGMVPSHPDEDEEDNE